MTDPERTEAEQLGHRRWVARPAPGHLAEADACEKQGNWFAASFHLEQVVNAGPPTRELQARIAKAKAMIPERLAMPREDNK